MPRKHLLVNRDRYFQQQLQQARDLVCDNLQQQQQQQQRPPIDDDAAPLSVSKNTQKKGGKKVFGQMQVTQMLALSKLETLDEAVAKLLEFAEYPKLLRWIQFPTALVVFLAHEDSQDSGAVYVYDRKRCVWLWVDFDDQNYGGYSPSEFDVLVNQCHFLRVVESPGLLHPSAQWFVTPGQHPERLARRPV